MGWVEVCEEGAADLERMEWVSGWVGSVGGLCMYVCMYGFRGSCRLGMDGWRMGVRGLTYREYSYRGASCV